MGREERPVAPGGRTGLQSTPMSTSSTSDGAPDPALRVAVIGAGPAGFYTVQQLLKLSEGPVHIDVFDRLPTPFGLVRSGVAPDHPKIKSVTTLYHRLALDPGFRFFGNVEYGRDLHLGQLRAHYDQIVFANGAQNDRRLGIPGEDLKGVHSAREFVAWYNGDPRHAHDSFELDAKAAVVIGVGNVAADVARILCRVHEKLAMTDIADYALDALDESAVRTVYVLGRRGPVQAKFSTPEIHELGELVDTETSIPAVDMALDEFSQAELDAAGERGELRRKFDALSELTDRKEPQKHRKLILRFLVSPVELLGDDEGRVRALRMVKNELRKDEETGWIGPQSTGAEEEIECGLVFRSVGYRGTAVEDLPFDDRQGVIPNAEGRVTDPDTGDTLAGLYAAGWIKRGPSGLIGSNKTCAQQTVEHMLEDASNIKRKGQDPSAILAVLDAAEARYVTYEDWMKIDAEEIRRGETQGRPRVKLTELDEILEFLGKA